MTEILETKILLKDLSRVGNMADIELPTIKIERT